MSILDSLITDRTFEDVERVQQLAAKAVNGELSATEQAEWDSCVLKGSYNYTDLARVVEALRYVADLLTAEGYTPDLQFTVATPQRDAIVTPEFAAEYLRNISELRAVLSLPGNVPSAPTDLDDLTVADANNIEKILLAVHYAYQGMKGSYVCCGVGTCGGDYL